jgi:glutaredoxin/glutathione-dependent peroxiredoxin
MAISQGDKLPDAVLRRMGDNGPEEITIEALTSGRKIVLFGLPGAFTPTCSSAHVPSFIRTKDAFFEKDIEEIICVAVNDVHIMRQWGEVTGATAAGLSMWADPASEFTTAIGMNFDVEALGFYGRSSRYAMIVENGVVTQLNQETERGVCDISGGETLLESLG